MSRRISLTLDDELSQSLEECLDRFGNVFMVRSRERAWIARWALRSGLRHIEKVGLGPAIEEVRLAQGRPRPTFEIPEEVGTGYEPEGWNVVSFHPRPVPPADGSAS